MDPFNHYTDEAIWHALELANLKSFIKDANNNNNDANYGLDMNISEGGSNIRLVSVFGFFVKRLFNQLNSCHKGELE